MTGTTFDFPVLLPVDLSMNKDEEYPRVSLLGMHCTFFEPMGLELRTQSQRMCKYFSQGHIFMWVRKSITCTSQIKVISIT